MTDKERKDFVKILILKRNKLLRDKRASKAFFMKAGIITKDGNLQKQYA